MRFVTVSSQFFALCSDDPEILQKDNRRPHVLVVSLQYKGRRMDFAVPMRSNIPPAAPKQEYFALPPRPSTKPRHHHGLHYIKMFPISKQYQEKFWVGNNPSYVRFQQIIDKNMKQIVSECQAYLDRYAAGDRPNYAVDIDNVIEKIELFFVPDSGTS